MDPSLLLLLLVVVTAVSFDFTNGFHDTANAMATSIATGALGPRTAVALSAVLNVVGAFLSVEVALTVTNAVIRIQDSNGAPVTALLSGHGHALLEILLAALVGAIAWNLLTWLFGLPSSSSHALFGGLIGATIAGMGWHGVKWGDENGHLDGVVGKVLLPALASPFVAGIVSMCGTFLVYRIIRGVRTDWQHRGFRWGQIGSASLVSLAHGTNDAQKTMGVITLALIGYGAHHDTHSVPVWVKLVCASSIALGTYLGGWRIIRTLGKGLVDIAPAQGMAAEAASASVILTSSHLGFALSTTHVATGSILGTGIGRPHAQVRWTVFGRMVVAWLITLPAAALMAAGVWGIGHLIGGILGPLIMMVLLIGFAAYMNHHAHKKPVGRDNVNDTWDEQHPHLGKPAQSTAAAAGRRDVSSR